MFTMSHYPSLGRTFDYPALPLTPILYSGMSGYISHHWSKWSKSTQGKYKHYKIPRNSFNPQGSMYCIINKNIIN